MSKISKLLTAFGWPRIGRELCDSVKNLVNDNFWNFPLNPFKGFIISYVFIWPKHISVCWAKPSTNADQRKDLRSSQEVFIAKKIRMISSCGVPGTLGLNLFHGTNDFDYSEEVKRHGFTIIIDMRESRGSSVKALLKALQETFPCGIRTVFVIKPDNHKPKSSHSSSKLTFEVSSYYYCRHWTSCATYARQHIRRKLCDRNAWKALFCCRVSSRFPASGVAC